MLLAAGAHLTAGANERARDLLGPSARLLVDSVARVQAMRMEGAIRFADGRGGDTPALLLEAGTALNGVDQRLARETLMEAMESAMWAAHLTSGATVLDVAEAARAMPDEHDDDATAYLLLTGYAERLTAGYPRGVQWWRRAARVRARDVRGHTRLQLLGMLWNATGELLDFESHAATARQRVRLAREEGALAVLPVALSCLAWCERLSGRIDAAEALVAEAIDIAAAIGVPSMPGAQGIMRLGMLVWRGREEEARLLAQGVNSEAVARAQGLAVTIVEYFLTTLELSYGRYEDARIHALTVYEADPLYVCSMALGDVIEATARSGDLDSAAAALARLTERALATQTAWGLGLLARGRALLAPDENAEPFYEEALAHFGRSGVVTELARTHLLYGEWLRRQRRRRDARTQLGIAYDTFGATGAAAFAHRASVELVATGEHTHAWAGAGSRMQLSPQEQQVARLAAEGDTNSEIAAQLFISPHTVAYHLREVSEKLGISARDQLVGALSDESPATVTM
jgi:DNA-binding CsgD family transcriptional regulator